MDSIIKAQVDFMKGHFLEMELFKDDLKKMEEVKRLNLCKSAKEDTFRKRSRLNQTKGV